METATVIVWMLVSINGLTGEQLKARVEHDPVHCKTEAARINREMTALGFPESVTTCTAKLVPVKL